MKRMEEWLCERGLLWNVAQVAGDYSLNVLRVVVMVHCCMDQGIRD